MAGSPSRCSPRSCSRPHERNGRRKHGDQAIPKGKARRGQGEEPVDGNPKNTRWVLYGGSARYRIGKFDGKQFTPDKDEIRRVHYGRYYASQVFYDAPGNRKVQIAWARIPMEGMPFSQMMSFPAELSLRTTPDGIRLFAEPVREVKTLYRKTHAKADAILCVPQPVYADDSKDKADMTLPRYPRADIIRVS